MYNAWCAACGVDEPREPPSSAPFLASSLAKRPSAIRARTLGGRGLQHGRAARRSPADSVGRRDERVPDEGVRGVRGGCGVSSRVGEGLRGVDVVRDEPRDSVLRDAPLDSRATDARLSGRTASEDAAAAAAASFAASFSAATSSPQSMVSRVCLPLGNRRLSESAWSM